MTTDWRRLREKLRDAATAVDIEREGSLKEGLRSAYVYGLSGLEPENFPDVEGRTEFVSLVAALNATGEAMEGEGSLPTTLWLMSDDEAGALGLRVIALADRYGARREEGG